MFTRYSTVAPSTHLSRAIHNHFGSLGFELGRLESPEPIRSFIDFYEDGDHYMLNASVPGYKPSQVNISLTGRDLKIVAEDHEHADDQEKGSRKGHRRQKFSRVVQLPDNVDLNEVSASLEHGLLAVKLPKQAKDAVRQIPIC